MSSWVQSVWLIAGPSVMTRSSVRYSVGRLAWPRRVPSVVSSNFRWVMVAYNLKSLKISAKDRKRDYIDELFVKLGLLEISPV